MKIKKKLVMTQDVFSQLVSLNNYWLKNKETNNWEALSERGVNIAK